MGSHIRAEMDVCSEQAKRTGTSSSLGVCRRSKWENASMILKSMQVTDSNGLSELRGRMRRKADLVGQSIHVVEVKRRTRGESPKWQQGSGIDETAKEN